MKIKNHYQTLEINENATIEQIKKAYRTLAIKYHPDKNFGDTYFSMKFIEIKDAYDTLSNFEARKAYDILYSQFFKTQTTETKQEFHEEKIRTEEYEEKFHYEPFKPFYSSRDREQNLTPQFNPIYDFQGNRLNDNIDFFILPKNIGKLICGYSNFFKNSPIKDSNKKKSIFEKLFGSFENYKYENAFVGVNGFAIFFCKNFKNNIIKTEEINFNDGTDLYCFYQDYVLNFIYQHTNFSYAFVDKNTHKIIWEMPGLFNKKKATTEHQQLNLCTNIEKYWTIYLLDNLEDRLQKDGFVSFTTYNKNKEKFEDFLKMGIGYMTFLQGKKAPFTYEFKDIKKIYSKGNELHIQHNNFQKKLFFLKSGDEDIVPLSDISNRSFFFKTLEILLGYKITH